MFIVLPTNVDYLISDVRLYVGDGEAKRFSDSTIRTSIINAVIQLQKKWDFRYLVFRQEMIVPDTQRVDLGVYYDYEYDENVHLNMKLIIPSGFLYIHTGFSYAVIPSGIRVNDVFRNPSKEFEDKTSLPIVQSDQFPVVLMSSILLKRAYLNSSAEYFTSWSDGDFSYNAISAGKILGTSLEQDIKMLDEYFKKRLALPVTRVVSLPD